MCPTDVSDKRARCRSDKCLKAREGHLDAALHPTAARRTRN